MKKYIIFILSVLLVSAAYAQQQVSVKMALEPVDCEGGNPLVVGFYVKNEGRTSFDISSLSLRFTHNKNALRMVKIAPNHQEFHGQHNLNHEKGITSYGVFSTGTNFTTLNPNSGYQKIGGIEFEVLNVNERFEFEWKEANQFPATVVLEIIEFSDQRVCDILDYETNNKSVSRLCPQPIAVSTGAVTNDDVKAINVSTYQTCIDKSIQLSTQLETLHNELKISWERSANTATISNLEALDPILSGWGSTGTYEYLLDVIDPYFPQNSVSKSVVVNVQGAEACDINSSVDDIVQLGYDVKILPNPTSGKFRIDITAQKSEIVNIFVLDLSGKETIIAKEVSLIKDKSQLIDFDLTGQVADGTYIIRFDAEHHQFAKQLIVVN